VALPLDDERMRTAFLGLLGLAVVAFVAALVATVMALDSAGAILLAAVVLLAIAVAGEVGIILFAEPDELEEDEAWTEAEEEAEREAAADEEYLIRCKQCGETFSVLDDGSRPLRHTCPRCGTSGEITDLPS
jgi:DNA-directed RNA polymerase subunit RPC12/RpoP